MHSPALAKSAKADDVVFVVLIGHGTFDGRVAKFNLPGPDMTPADFDAAAEEPRSRGRSCSSTPRARAARSSRSCRARTHDRDRDAHRRRAVCDAVRRLLRRRAAGDAADADKNRRVSVLEAFDAAQLGVGACLRAGRASMLTEHPLLDDSGDKQGSPDPKPDGKNGRDRRGAVARHAGVGRGAARGSEAARAVRGAARRSSAASKA